jgi:hypothetical protein
VLTVRAFLSMRQRIHSLSVRYRQTGRLSASANCVSMQVASRISSLIATTVLGWVAQCSILEVGRIPELKMCATEEARMAADELREREQILEH